jgi:hypothetical protein
MNPCEKILAEMKPVIRAYHTNRWLPENPPPPPEEKDLYRLLMPAVITLLFVSLVIAFLILIGWKRRCPVHSGVATITSE